MRELDTFQGDVDVLSAIGRRLLRINVQDAYDQLLPNRTGSTEAGTVLETLRPEQLLAAPVRDASAAAGALAGLWLRHDFLDRAHRLVQNIDTPAGAFWHAIIHRREGDFPNAQYWYARAADHPARAPIAAQASAILDPLPADTRLLKLTLGGWNGAAFVDLVASVSQHPSDPLHGACVALGQLEWRILFDYSLRAAAGR